MNEYDQRRLEECPEITPYFSDIPQSVATRAYHATSHFPERAASIIKSDYATSLLGDLERVNKIICRAEKQGAELLADKDQAIQRWFKAHREGLKARFVAYLHSHSAVMSAMITGPAKFPTARNQKCIDWAQNHYDAISTFQHTSIKRVMRELLPWGDGSAIATNDPRALEKIQAKIAKLERDRDIMKEINKITRRFYKKGITEIGPEKHTECVNELVGFTGYSADKIELCLKPCYGRVIPFERYQLTNPGAEIRRLKVRLSAVSHVQAVAIDDVFSCATVSISDKQQIAIVFDGKPNESVRNTLKSNGFKWSRYQVAWVRKMTENSIAVYERIVKPFLGALETID